MKQGDFTALAKQYINRPGYSVSLLKVLQSNIKEGKKDIIVADIGAGTGKLTENLIHIGLTGVAIEPNDSMRSEGIKNIGNDYFRWIKGSAENTNMKDSSVDWVIMGSSFHWTDTKLALMEIHRILKLGGFFTALWNPRDKRKSNRELVIDNKIEELIPNYKRLSSGYFDYTNKIEENLLSTEYFKDLIYMEACHKEEMSRERYLGVWRSVNDVQAQAGVGKFNILMDFIGNLIKDEDQIVVPYITRAWTVKSQKGY